MRGKRHQRLLLAGLAQYYATASPGMVFDALVKGRHANPVLVVDV